MLPTAFRRVVLCPRVQVEPIARGVLLFLRNIFVCQSPLLFSAIVGAIVPLAGGSLNHRLVKKKKARARALSKVTNCKPEHRTLLKWDASCC